MLSLPVSFLSLAQASTRLFFSQRLGVFSETNPSFKMILLAIPFNFFLLLGPVFSLILTASYFQHLVLIQVAITIALSYFILKYIHFRNKGNLKKIIKDFYNDMKEYGTKESSQVFFNAVFTSWCQCYETFFFFRTAPAI
jgi:hypothetical protein